MAARKKKNELDDIFDDLHAARGIISTGVPLVDGPIGGGIPEGILLEAYGPPASGKSSLGYTHIGMIQRLGGGTSILIDAEESFNVEMAERCGIDLDHIGPDGKPTFRKLSDSKFKLIENVFDTIKHIIYNYPDVRFIMIDSLAALIPADMMKKDANLARSGLLKAKLLTDYWPMLSQWLNEANSKASIYVVNHEKVEVGFSGRGPAKSNTPGGVVLKYLASMRLEFRIVKTDKIEALDPVTEQVVKETDKLYIRVTATKNRFHRPGKPATFVFKMGTGIDRVCSTLAHAFGQGLVEKTAQGWVTIPDTFTHTGEVVKLHGKGKAEDYFAEHAAELDKLEAAVVDNLDASRARLLTEDSSEEDLTLAQSITALSEAHND